MQLRDIRDLIPFVNYLEKNKIHYRLTHPREETIGVYFTLVTVRVELEFFENEIQFSTYHGDETVETDSSLLFKLIDENWD